MTNTIALTGGQIDNADIDIGLESLLGEEKHREYKKYVAESSKETMNKKARELIEGADKSLAAEHESIGVRLDINWDEEDEFGVFISFEEIAKERLDSDVKLSKIERTALLKMIKRWSGAGRTIPSYGE
jgi:hypothetical protein